MRLPMNLPLYLVIYAVILNCKVFGEEEIICPDSDEIVFLASSKSCSEYYMCFGGSPIAMTCFDNLHFNFVKQSCDLPKSAQCTIVGATAIEGKTSVRPPTHTQSSVKASPTPGVVHTHKPTPPEIVLTKSTVLPSTGSPSTMATFTSRPLTESTVLPSTESPSTMATFTSRPLTESTVLPSTQSPSTMATFTSRPLTESTVLPSTESPSTPAKTTVLPKTPYDPVSSLDVKTQCEVKLAGYFVYPEDCHFYYRCMNGVLSLQECPWDFGFDVNKKACNFSGCSTQGK